MVRAKRQRGALKRLFGLGALLSLAHCSASSPQWGAALGKACQVLALCEPVVEAPELVDLVLDRYSPAATPDHVGSTFDHLLPRLSQRPTSRLRVWATTEREGEVQLLAEVRSPALLTGRHRATRHDLGEWMVAARMELMTRVVPVLASPPSTPPSLAAALARVMLAVEEGGARQLVVLADGYDVALGTFACDVVPVGDVRVSNVPLRRWLTDGLMAGATVHLTYFSPRAPEGCPVNALRLDILQSVWGRLLAAAGAKEVLIEGGPVHFSDEAFAFAHKNGWKWWAPEHELP